MPFIYKINNTISIIYIYTQLIEDDFYTVKFPYYYKLINRANIVMPKRNVQASHRKAQKHPQSNNPEQLQTPTEKLMLGNTPKNLGTTIKKKQTPQPQQIDEQVTLDCDSNEADKVNQMLNKLFARNKISCKNAFDVPIIDVNTLNGIRGDGEGSWNKISSSLENSSRIYGLRVDSVATNISAMTNLMLRSEATDHIQERIQPLADCNPKDEKQFAKEMNYFKFIQKDTEKLDLLGIYNRQNPIIQETRRKFDQNGVNGMLLNTITISHALELEIYQPQQGIQPNKIDIQQNPTAYIQLPCMQPNQHISILQQISMLRNYLLNPQQSLILIDLEDNNQTQFNQLMMADPENHLPNIIEMQIQKPDQFVFEDTIYTQSQSKKSILKVVNTKCSKKKKKNKAQKVGRKKRAKAAQKYLQFDQEVLNCRQTTFSIDSSAFLKIKPGPFKYQDKNLQLPIFLDSKTQFQIAIQESSRILQGIKPPQEHFEEQEKYSFIKQELSVLNRHTNFSMLSQLATQCQRNTSISITKKKLNNLLIQDNQLSSKFSTIYQQYGSDNSGSQQICFLSILHLCNQNNLELSEISDKDFLITRNQ